MNKKFVTYSVLTCTFSWLCWLPILPYLEGSPFESPLPVLAMFFVGAYGPSIMGVLLTAFYDGKKGLKSLWQRACKIRVDWLLLSLALLAGPALSGAAAALMVSNGGQLGSVNYGLLPWLPLVFIVPIIFGPLAEEFGWRGFALPQLNYQQHFIRTSITLGAVWALWHAPLFWAKTGTAISAFPVTPSSVSLFFMAVIGSSFIYTWLFQRTAGSVFVAIVLHLSMNASGIALGMLFPDLSQKQNFTIYQLYTLAVWLVVLTGWVWHLVRRPQLSSLSYDDESLAD